ncbi:universal stress protein [Massilia glaciei]|uniref:Universal stress protein n=1 Tax=Massilia glaciei TaxID=1524097 RepID=A0A2U2HGD4_9BURK|nr:universal stress protein [Massilia glaciei]PWF43990.1 universal stress protein [Massilia glaciei]
MSYKTILVHVDDSPQAAERVGVAAGLAQAHGAHLIGLALTDASPLIYYVGGGFDISDPSLASQLEASRQAAEKALQQFESLARGIGVASFERRLEDGEAWPGFTLQARYCDLVVICQSSNQADAPRYAADFSEHVVLNWCRPTLIIPAAGHVGHPGQRVLIAWNAGMAAARAVAGALPLLRRARQVDVAVFNPEREPYDAHGAEPGADVALYLARHGVRVGVKPQTIDTSVGDALLSAAADWSSDLVVMGAYGHSRFRELILGGTTRTVLQSMAVPVLMMH